MTDRTATGILTTYGYERRRYWCAIDRLEALGLARVASDDDNGTDYVRLAPGVSVPSTTPRSARLDTLTQAEWEAD